MAKPLDESCSINNQSIEKFAKKLITTILPQSFNSHFSLAGGCFKSLIHHREPNDIDLWPASDSDRAKLIQELVNQGGEVESEGEFNTVLTRAGSPRIEVTKKCPSSLDICLSNFDLVLSCIGVEFKSGQIIDSHINIDVRRDVAKQEVRIVDQLKPHKYNLLTIKRMQRYSNELGYSIPSSTIEDLWRIAYSGATREEREALLEAANLILSDVPLGFNIERIFTDGYPLEKCRPFTEAELDTMKTKLLKGHIISEKHENYGVPNAVFVTGLADSGKTTVIKHAIHHLGIGPIKNMVNLDMNELRSNHSQFNALLQGTSLHNNQDERVIFKNLIPWFNGSSDAEHALYKKNESIFQTILQDRRDFVLPISCTRSLDYMKDASKMFGYRPYLIEIRVSVAIAQERALRRARATGLYVSKQYIEKSQEELSEVLRLGKELVNRYNGVVAIFDNNLGGGARLLKCDE